MTTIAATRRRLAALLVLPLLLVLAGCGKLHADFEIKDADTIHLSIDLAIDEEFAGTSFDSASEMCDDLADELDLVGDSAPTIEPYEADSQFGCRMNGVIKSEDFGSDFNLVEKDGEYHFTIAGDETTVDGVTASDMGMLDIDFQMSFTFPGKIIESAGGEIDGNTVTYTDISELASGVDIRAKANTFPWVIVVVALLVVGFFFLVILAAVIFFVLRSRSKKNAAGVNAPAAFGAAGGAAAAGAAGSAMSPAAPQQEQQPWGQQASPPAPQQDQPWGQQPSPAAPQQEQQPWGQPSPPAPQQDQPWSRPPEPGQGGQPGQQNQPGQPDQPGQQNPGGNPWDHPDQGGQGPQNPSW